MSHRPDQSNPLSRMILRSAILGKRLVLGSSSPVNGLVLFPSANHFSISARSYVWPSAVGLSSPPSSTGTLKRKKRLPLLLLLAQLATCFLLVLALVLLLALPPTPEQRWKQQSALLLMIHPKTCIPLSPAQLKRAGGNTCVRCTQHTHSNAHTTSPIWSSRVSSFFHGRQGKLCEVH